MEELVNINFSREKEGGKEVRGERERKRKRECIRVSFNFLMREPARRQKSVKEKYEKWDFM